MYIEEYYIDLKTELTYDVPVSQNSIKHDVCLYTKFYYLYVRVHLFLLLNSI